MTSKIKIGDVSLPLNEFAVSGTAILGIKKAGKTWCAKGIAEQLLEHSIPIIVFDAIGVWRFLKTPGDSPKARGYKVVVAGGEEPDLPLTAHNAAEIIRASMRSNVSVVIDLYDPKLSKTDWRKIVQSCFRTLLYENKKFGPRYVFLEEAAEYVPQKIYDTDTYGEVEKFVRMGGNAQLGVALINQRSQEVNKSVLDLCDNLVLMRQRGNSAIDAVQKWMDKVSPDIADRLTASLPNMQKGDAWVWAEESDTPVRTHTGLIKSFHPDRTLSQKAVTSRKTEDVDDFVEKLRSDLGKVVEEAKANDPRELKQEVARLRAELKKAPAAETRTEIKEIQKPIFDDKDRKLMEKAIRGFQELKEMVESRVEALRPIYQELNAMRGAVEVLLNRQKALPTIGRLPKLSPRVASQPRGRLDATVGDFDVRGGLKRMMIALAQRSPLTKKQLGVRAGLSSSSGTFGTYLGRLRSNEWVEGSDQLVLTDAGVAALGSYEPLPEGQELLDYWLNELGESGASRMLRCLAERYPEAISREALGELAEISHTSGTFGTYLGKLRTLELVEGSGASLRAAKEFFE